MSETESDYGPLAWEGAIDLLSPDLTPEKAASAVARTFGERATTVAAWCAIEARQQDDDAGYHLWLAAFKQLRAPQHPGSS